MMDSPNPQEVRARLAAMVVMLDRLLHDLKQPLNFVRMVAQDVRLDAKKDRLKLEDVPDNMDEIIGAVDRLVTSINQLRAFARPSDEAGQRLTVVLADACRAAAARVRMAIPDATIEEQFAEQLPAVNGDPFYVEQVVWELLDNALRATHAVGAPRAVVRTVRCGEGVSVRVTNDGPGIPEQHRTKVFEPFFSTREGAGGLGLALARALASKLHAELELLASDENGTTFEFLFPTTLRHEGTTED